MIALNTQTIIEKLPKWIKAGRPKTWQEWQQQNKANGNGRATWRDELAEIYRDKSNDPGVENEPLFG